MQPIISQLTPVEVEEFEGLSNTIGGMLVFPSNKIDGKPTINGARGMHPRIADRMDLTLECIRRHYLGQLSPLVDVLSRYADLFTLSDDFEGYVRFFLLDDLVTHDNTSVRFFLRFEDFTTPALPRGVDTYIEYRRRSIEFVEARNSRFGGLRHWLDSRTGVPDRDHPQFEAPLPVGWWRSDGDPRVAVDCPEGPEFQPDYVTLIASAMERTPAEDRPAHCDDVHQLLQWRLRPVTPRSAAW